MHFPEFFQIAYLNRPEFYMAPTIEDSKNIIFQIVCNELLDSMNEYKNPFGILKDIISGWVANTDSRKIAKKKKYIGQKLYIDNHRYAYVFEGEISGRIDGNYTPCGFNAIAHCRIAEFRSMYEWIEVFKGMDPNTLSWVRALQSYALASLSILEDAEGNGDKCPFYNNIMGYSRLLFKSDEHHIQNTLKKIKVNVPFTGSINAFNLNCVNACVKDSKEFIKLILAY